VVADSLLLLKIEDILMLLNKKIYIFEAHLNDFVEPGKIASS
jgi:hypothetical protein